MVFFDVGRPVSYLLMEDTLDAGNRIIEVVVVVFYPTRSGNRNNGSETSCVLP